MRRIVSFVLLLVMILSMACPVLAATDSIPNRAPVYSGDNPKTGDIIMTWVIIMALAAAALVAVVVIYRKKSA